MHLPPKQDNAGSNPARIAMLLDLLTIPAIVGLLIRQHIKC
jgi:hypothetical protein